MTKIVRTFEFIALLIPLLAASALVQAQVDDTAPAAPSELRLDGEDCSTCKLDLHDAFEGTPPTGWNSFWIFKTTSSSADGDCVTTAAGGVPPGGGSYALQQHRILGRPSYLRYYLNPLPAEGDVFRFEYWTKYHEKFDIGGSTHKSIMFKQNIEAGEGSQIYIMPWYNGATTFYLQNMWKNDVPPIKENRKLRSNINGATYVMPLGVWVKFRWEWKVASQDSGSPNGYVYGWITQEGGTEVKRWEYENIYTKRFSAMPWHYTEFGEWTMNPNAVQGDYQKRWWDQMRLTVDSK